MCACCALLESSKRKRAVEEELVRIQATRDFITYKCWFYDEAVRLGSEEKVHELSDDKVPPEMLKIRKRCFEDKA